MIFDIVSFHCVGQELALATRHTLLIHLLFDIIILVKFKCNEKYAENLYKIGLGP